MATLRNADTYDVDPSRIALWGYSAGAHLSLLAANHSRKAPAASDCEESQATIQACVAGAAPTDLRAFGEARPVRDLLGGSPEELGGVYLDASPLFGVSPQNPPTFLYHGRGDWIVDVDHSRRMRNALAEAGVTVELVESSRGHFSEAIFAQDSIEKALEFLDGQFG